MGKFMKYIRRGLILLLSLVLLASAVIVTASLGDFRVRCEEIPGKVLRLHVLANSDSEADQALKLKVRDAVLRKSGKIFSGTKTKAEAMGQARRYRKSLEAAARQALRENGCEDPVTARLETVYFNTRTYGEVTLPAGYYDAVQVRIGRGEGHNWWCVMFPALCVPSASGAEMEDVLSEEEMAVVRQEGYDVRFQIVEWYEALSGWLR